MTLPSDRSLAALTEQMQTAVDTTGRQIEAFFDAAFPDRVRLREEAARAGYQGRRFGWYPEKPKRRR